ncbi:MAG: SDR family NAD(P)-dependent oxidoreductase [Succinivibrio sp.]
MELLRGKRALITGAHRGIGRAVMEKFASYGCDLMLLNRCEDSAFTEKCAELAAQYGVEIELFYADFESEDAVKAAAKQITSAKKQIDILVNNIGVSKPLNMFTMTKIEVFRHAFEVNFFSAITLTQTVARQMMRKKSGAIVFVSSTAVYDAWANIEYTASKSAIIGAAKRMALELGPFGIRVNTVAPGLTATDMGNSMKKEDEDIALSRNIMRRKGEPSEIADVIAFLSSDMSSFMTGQVIRVDGGLLG